MNYRNTLWLDVQVAPGSDIYQTCRDGIALSNLLGITIWFDFNGVKCCARPGDCPDSLAEAWNATLQSKSTFKIAVANK